MDTKKFSMIILALIVAVPQVFAQNPVWSEDFSSLSPGSRWINRQETEVMRDGGVNNSQCVRVEYEIRTDPLGSTIRRSHMKVPPALEYTLQYDLYFESNWTNSYGGKFGGFGPEQGVAGCNDVQPHTWSARIVLRNREPRLYLYHQDKGPGCGESVNSDMQLQKERWYSVSYYVKVNSRADRSDGEAELYIDGKLVASRRDLKFHAENGDHTKISTIDFTTFLVRNSTGPIVSRQHMRYDNFAVVPGRVIRQSPGDTPSTGNEPPVVSVTSPENNAAFTLGETITITADASVEEGLIDRVNFRVNGDFHSQDQNPPYTASFTPDQPGIYTIDARAFDDEELSTLSSSINVFVSEPKGPFSGEPVNLPGTIMAVEYDKGGEGVSYHDTSPENRGVELRDIDFRVDEGVDIDNHPDEGYVIGWIADGEWVEYTVDVTEVGEYELEFHVASRDGGGSIGIDVDGETLLSEIVVPETGDWHSYATFTQNVNLDAGEQVWRVNMESAGFNLHKIVVRSEGTTGLADKRLSAHTTKPRMLPNNGTSRLFYLSREATWNVYSLQGARLSSGKSNVIDMSTFSNGIYMIKFEGEIERLMLR